MRVVDGRNRERLQSTVDSNESREEGKERTATSGPERSRRRGGEEVGDEDGERRDES